MAWNPHCQVNEGLCKGSKKSHQGNGKPVWCLLFFIVSKSVEDEGCLRHITADVLTEHVCSKASLRHIQMARNLSFETKICKPVSQYTGFQIFTVSSFRSCLCWSYWLASCHSCFLLKMEDGCRRRPLDTWLNLSFKFLAILLNHAVKDQLCQSDTNTPVVLFAKPWCCRRLQHAWWPMNAGCCLFFPFTMNNQWQPATLCCLERLVLEFSAIS